MTTDKTEFLTKAKFSKLVIKKCKISKLNTMDSVLNLCVEFSIDPLDIRKFINKTVKLRLESEAVKLNMLKHENDKNMLEL